MRQILFLCLLMASLSEAKLPPQTIGVDSIYGKDDRELITDKSATAIKKLSKSVGMFLSSEYLETGFLRTTIKAESLKKAFNMCATEKFLNKPSLPNCTGFLVGPDLVATAGHCFQSEDDCINKKFILDLNDKNQGPNGYVVFSHNVYSCKEIIASQFSDESDYALIRLNRSPRRAPLKLNRSEKKISDNANVFMIGYPLGLPTMLSTESKISENSGVSIFKALLDSFEGNSGSPVFNSQTLEVEGILVSGQEDFVQDSPGGCYRNMTYEGRGGEGIFRINELLPFLN